MKTQTKTVMMSVLAASFLGFFASEASAVDCRTATKLVGVYAADGTPVSAGDAVAGTADLRDGNGEVGQTLRINVSHLFPNRAYRIFINGKRVNKVVKGVPVLDATTGKPVPIDLTTAGAGNGSVVLGTGLNADGDLPVANVAGLSLEIEQPNPAGRIVRLSANSLLCTPPKP